MPLALRAGAPGHPQRLLMELWERGNEFGLTPQAGGAPLGAGGGVGTSWQLPLVALNFVLLPVRLPGLVSAGSEIPQNGANNGRLLLIPRPNKCWGQLCAARCSEPSKRQGVSAALVASPRPPGPKGSRVRSLGAGYQSVPRVVPLQGIQEDYSLISLFPSRPGDGEDGAGFSSLENLSEGLVGSSGGWGVCPGGAG